MSKSEVTLKAVREAYTRIHGAVYFSPCPNSPSISEISGQPVYLKLENLQRTGAFKERGALNKLLTLSEHDKKRGVIAASAGNHAQGVAFHARNNGISAKIVMPVMTPLVKSTRPRNSALTSSCTGTGMMRPTRKPVVSPNASI